MNKSKAHNPPIIRPGQKTPYRRATAEEIERRIEECGVLLAKRLRKSQIREHFRKTYGLHWLTVDKIYIVRARKLLVKRSQKSVENARADGVAFLDHVIATGTLKEGLSAEARQAEIFGYNAPRRQEIGGPGGGPIPVAATGFTQEELDRGEQHFIERLRFSAAQKERDTKPAGP